jgi:hypothetical protein
MGTNTPPAPRPRTRVYRLSWLAYVNVILKLLAFIAVSVGIGWWALSLAHTELTYQLGIAASVAVLLVALAVCVYNILYLKSVRLYTDDIGVWLYRGILPWSKGVLGVKWRDMEDAMYYTGFFNWMFRSYRVRIGHRFTKTSEIFLNNLAQGHKAVEHINQLHQSTLKAEQIAGLSQEV